MKNLKDLFPLLAFTLIFGLMVYAVASSLEEVNSVDQSQQFMAD